MAPRLARTRGSLAHSFLLPSSGGSPRNRLLREGRAAEPGPQQEAARGGPPSPLSTNSSQLHLRAPVPAALDPRTQASLSRGSAQGPWLPEFLGCLGPPLRLRRRWDCLPPSSPSTRCHWLREGARGRFSGSCTSRSEGKGSAQAHSLGGLPALTVAHRALHPLPASYPSNLLPALPTSLPAAPAARPGLRHASLQLLPRPGIPFPRHVSATNSHLPVLGPTSPAL